MDKFEKSAFIMLTFGIILLVFTFFCAYGFLAVGSNIFGSQNIVQTFDEAAAPLIEGITRTLFLGVMGWIGSIFTTRGVQLLKREKELAPLPQSSAKEEKESAAKGPQPEAKGIDPEKEKPSKAEEPNQAKIPEPKEAEVPEKSDKLIEPPSISVPAS